MDDEELNTKKEIMSLKIKKNSRWICKSDDSIWTVVKITKRKNNRNNDGINLQCGDWFTSRYRWDFLIEFKPVEEIIHD